MTQAEQDAREFICHKYDEINEKRWGTWKWKDIINSSLNRTSFDQIADWMEQYRNEGLREELKGFMEFYMTCDTKTTLLTDDKFIDEYLKQKP